MSVLQSRPEDNIKKTSDHTQLPVIDINVILKRLIQQLPAAVRSTLVLRCDELPKIYGPEENVQKVLSELLQIITEKAASKTLYLHITCNIEDAPEEKEGIFLLRFHTNLTPNEWLESNNEKVNRIAALLTPFGGRVQINQLKNSGCIFVLSLPRKQ